MLLSNPYTHDGRVRQEVRSIVAAGHRVTVVAWDREGQATADERLDGARIVRVDHTRWMRMLAYDLLRLRGWWRLATRTGLVLQYADPVDLVHAHDLDTLPSGVELKQRLGVPLLFDAHEIWGHMVAKDLPPPLPQWFLAKERRLAPRADHIVTVSAPLAEHFQNVAPRVPVTQVLNCKDIPSGSPTASKTTELTVSYIGSLNRTRHVTTLLDAVDGQAELHAIVAGSGPGAYAHQVEEQAKGMRNAEWLGRIAADTVIPTTERSDIVACLFAPDDPLTRVGLPNKVFEAMAAGRAVLASEGTYVGGFVVENAMGVAVRPEASEIRAVLLRLAKDRARVAEMGAHARSAGQSTYNWDTQAKRLLAAYDALLADGPSGSTGGRGTSSGSRPSASR